mmetsp:Transcript_138122/g.240134  ORF Transcript_138122/g.240134 Transcript_138122/m.240134 type:complete len:1001 (-) Transcript_138122:310-3312(-)
MAAPATSTEHSLRGYQKELLELCKQRNSIVIAPTGCGKTKVAVALAEHFLNPNAARRGYGFEHVSGPQGKRFVVFLAKTRPLIEQQAEVFEDSPLRLRVLRVSGGHKSVGSWRDVRSRYDVVVCIDTLFLSALQYSRDDIALSDVALLIFDEAHNAVGQAAACKIMQYFYAPLAPSQRPHILGLTASPGDDITPERTERRIMELTQTLDSELAIVTKCQAELDACVNKFEQKILAFELNQQEHQLRTIIVHFCTVVQDILSSHQTSLPGKGLHYQIVWDDFDGAPGTSLYTEFVDQQYHYAQNFERRGIQFAFDCLKGFSEAMALLMELSMQDSLKHLDERFFQSDLRNWNKNADLEDRIFGVVHNRITDQGKIYPDSDEVDKENNYFGEELVVALRDMAIALDPLLQVDPLPSQKLGLLLKELESANNDDTEFRGIVFTDTKKGTRRIVQSINNTPSLKGAIRPKEFVGHQRTQVDDGVLGMNTKQQQRVVSQFKEGVFNLLVATSVAEEGLDIPQCNLVIRYEAQFSVKSMIQSRGRARKQDSLFVLIVEKGVLEGRYREAVKRERMMQDAVRRIFLSPVLRTQVQGTEVEQHELNPVAVLTEYHQMQWQCPPEFVWTPINETTFSCAVKVRYRLPTTGEEGYVVGKGSNAGEKKTKNLAAADACKQLKARGVLKSWVLGQVGGLEKHETKFLPGHTVAKTTKCSPEAQLIKHYDPDTWMEPKTPHQLLIDWATRKCKVRLPTIQYQHRQGSDIRQVDWRATVHLIKRGPDGQDHAQKYHGEWAATRDIAMNDAALQVLHAHEEYLTQQTVPEYHPRCEPDPGQRWADGDGGGGGPVAIRPHAVDKWRGTRSVYEFTAVPVPRRSRSQAPAPWQTSWPNSQSDPHPYSSCASAPPSAPAPDWKTVIKARIQAQAGGQATWPNPQPDPHPYSSRVSAPPSAPAPDWKTVIKARSQAQASGQATWPNPQPDPHPYSSRASAPPSAPAPDWKTVIKARIAP